MVTDYTNLPTGTSAAPDPVDTIRTAQSTSISPRHLAHPLRLVDGPGGIKVFATLEQDSLDEVTQSLRILLSTERGERYRDAPDYGVDELMTGDPVTVAGAQAAVATYEPRAKVTFTPGVVTAGGQQVVRVDVELAEGTVSQS